MQNSIAFARRLLAKKFIPNFHKSPLSSMGYQGPLSDVAGINNAVVSAKYAVRGELVSRAEELGAVLSAEGSAGVGGKFSKIIYCNIGNPQSLKQAPLTFAREVVAAAACPSVAHAVSPDAAERAGNILADAKSLGAYSHSKGVPYIRKRVAKALEKRDGGAPADHEHIFLTNGASDGVKAVLNMLVRNSSDGVLIPVPQYPLYSASMTLFSGTRVDYFLSEEHSWGLNMDNLKQNIHDAKNSGVDVRAIVVINPGNPTGQTLSRDNMVALIEFCENNHLLILADEVYQANVYDSKKPFISFKQVVHETGSQVQLASFHSISKGVSGECGFRGGFVEVHNFPQDVVDQLYKLMSINLCSNLPGQCVLDVMMTPPVQGEHSYEKYVSEQNAIFDSLKRRAIVLGDALNQFEGVTCNASEGAMYLFPKIRIPKNAIEAAQKLGRLPDAHYCFELLENTGICVVPGSGFGQEEGTWHFRTTFLPPEDEIDAVVEKMGAFHKSFLNKYT